MQLRLSTWWYSLSQLVKQSVIIGACILLNIGCFATIYCAAKKRAESQYVILFQAADDTMDSLIRKKYLYLTNTRTEILQNQYTYLQQKREFFKMRLVAFYIAYISVVGCSLIMSLIIAASLAFIANRGWASTSPSTRFLFVTIAIFATLYASILGVFNLEQNATNNLILFNEHKSIQIDIYDYLTTSRGFVNFDSVKVYKKTDSMIHYTNQ